MALGTQSAPNQTKGAILLTAKLLEKIDPAKGLNGMPAPGGRLELWDELIEGFGYRATRKGRGSFFVMYRIAGERRRMTIGHYPKQSLAVARGAAEVALDAVARGIDPREEAAAQVTAAEALRQAEAAAEAAVDDRRLQKIAGAFVLRYLRGVDKNGKPKEPPNRKSWKEGERHLNKYVLPAPIEFDGEKTTWGESDIVAIKRRHVPLLLKRVHDLHGPIQANRVHATIRKLFNWALVQPELIDVLEANPIIKGMAPAQENERDRFLSAAEITFIWPLLRDKVGYPFGHFAMMLLVTAQRRGEVACMRDAAIDETERLWRLTKRSTKANRSHDIMLSDLALELIAEIREKRLGYANGVREAGAEVKPTGPFLFSTDGGETPISGFSYAIRTIKEELQKALNELAADQPDLPTTLFEDHWQFHDLRRTAATILEDDLSIAKPVISTIVNHAEEGATRIYTKGELRKHKLAAMQALGRYLTQIISPGGPNNVVQLHA